MRIDQPQPAETNAKPGKGLLARLRDDTRGNTLAIVGAALIPLTAMIGSGVDMSRAYMAKTRLQSACDAASLAGRRVMTNDTVNQTVIDEANRFFDFNFPDGLYETAPITPTVTRPAAGTVRVTASTTIPTAVMQIFGFNTLPLNVTCDASLNFVNTDVMLVLDTTGSMHCTPEESGLCGRTFEIANSRIVGLRAAVMALYDELAPIQTQLEANNLRLRYGIVNYSTTVNVGAAIRAVNPAYLSDSWTYPSRTPIYATSSTPVRVGTSMNNSTCNGYRQPRTPPDSFPATEKVVARPGSGTNRPCDVTTITYTEGTGATFAGWWHEPVVYDTSVYKTGVGTVLLPTRVPGTNTTAPAWNGCIEERDTLDTITSASGLTIPTGAYDLDINLIPSTPATQWRPMWKEVMYRDTNDNINTTAQSDANFFPTVADYNREACPREARTLRAWTRADLETYVNSIAAAGYTYHDIGMIWGTRMLSGQGIFAASNPDTFNGMPVARHIIFMTDGELMPDADAYTSYGIEEIDERITGGNGNATSRHMQRFWMACNAARQMGMQVWVIAFGVTLTPEMQQCASSNNHARAAASQAELLARFREIGANIGALRLTQ